MSPRRLVRFFWKVLDFRSLKWIDLTETAKSRPDSSVAHETSTFFAPTPPDIRRSAPGTPISPGKPGRASFRPRLRSSSAKQTATVSENFCEYLCLTLRSAVSGGLGGRVFSAATKRSIERLIVTLADRSALGFLGCSLVEDFAWELDAEVQRPWIRSLNHLTALAGAPAVDAPAPIRREGETSAEAEAPVLDHQPPSVLMAVVSPTAPQLGAFTGSTLPEV